MRSRVWAWEGPDLGLAGETTAIPSDSSTTVAGALQSRAWTFRAGTRWSGMAAAAGRPELRRLRGVGPARVGTRDRAEDGGDHRGLGVGFGDPPGLEFRAAGVDERHEHRQVPRGGDLGAEVAGGLPAFDERQQRAEHGAVPAVELIVRPGADVNGDQRV